VCIYQKKMILSGLEQRDTPEHQSFLRFVTSVAARSELGNIECCVPQASTAIVRRSQKDATSLDEHLVSDAYTLDL
jgi:hypothetical protein